jgi:POT family proton-dependent oligopeptide transporter
LGEKVGWHYGFGAAGVGMLISLVIYLYGRRFLPPDPPVGAMREKVDRPPMTGREWRSVILLVCLLPVLAASIVGNNQIFNAYLIWADTNVDRHLFGVPILTTWLVSVDSIVSVVTLAGMVIFWRWWKTRFPEPDELGKIVIGCLFSGAGVACLAAGSMLAAATGQKVAMGWLLAFHLLNDIGFANVLPVGLALFVRAAPTALAGTIVGIYYLHLFAGNLTVGWLGGFLDKMPAPQFWLMHAALVIGAGVVFFVVRLLFGGLLAGEPEEPDMATVVVADAGEIP